MNCWKNIRSTSTLYDDTRPSTENGNQFRVYRQLSVKRRYENKDEQRDELTSYSEKKILRKT